MAVTTTNLGVITAYGDAVAAGYTGTKAEWQALMASYATVGQQAVDAKNDAVAAKNTAVSKATEATTAANTATTKANEASASAQSIAESAAQIQENTDDIDQLKSESTALTSDGVVPSAEQILTDKGITDSVPYHYRKTGGDGADRLYDQIVGGTVCFNQLFNTSNYAQSTTSNGITFTNNGDGTVTANGTATARANFSLGNITVISGHVYIYGTPDTNNAERWIGNSTYGTQNGMKYMYKIIVNGLVGMNCMVASGITLNNYVFKPQLIDLTAMFGTTIADYVYSIETATAGAGVAWLKAHFPRIFNAGYVPYNAGELVSVQASAHKMTGFNQWDEEWELGTYNGNTGEKISVNSCIRSKNAINCFPDTYYYLPYLTGGIYLFFYDFNGNYIGTVARGGGILQIPNGVHQIRFRLDAAYGTTYNHDSCINLSDPAKNGTYEPYKAHSYPLDSTLTLRGLFKLDANNNLYADGDTYDADGMVTRKYGVVDLGELGFAYESSIANKHFFVQPNFFPKKPKYQGELLSTIYAGTKKGYYAIDNMEMCIDNSADTPVFRIRNDAYTSASDFKSAMSGVMLVYELATPTTEEADPYQHLQQCDPNGTEEYVSTGIVPIGHNSFYPENLRAKVEQLPWNFANLIAPTESTFTATRNYTTGALFIVDNVLYKATSNIANGGTITPNTNCTATTLAEIISALA